MQDDIYCIDSCCQVGNLYANTGHGSKGWTYSWGSAVLLAKVETKQLYCSQIKIFCADCVRGKYRKYQPGELWSQKIPSAEKMDWKLRKMFRLLFRCGRCSAQTHIIMWNTHLAKVIFEVLTSNVESEVTKAQGILDWIEYLLDFGQKEQKDWPRGDRMGNVLTTYLIIVPRPTQLDIISIL